MIYRTVKYLETGELIGMPSVKEKIDVCLLHFDRLVKLKGEYVAVREMRKHASWYLKSIRGNAGIRKGVNQAETEDELKTLLLGFAKEMENEPAAASAV